MPRDSWLSMCMGGDPLRQERTDPFRLGEGKVEGFVEVLTAERSVDRKEAGTQRGMNVAKLQC